MNRLLFLACSFALLFSVCSKEDDPLSPTPPKDVRGLYIVNEGNFQRNNASLSYFIPDSNVVYNDIFRSVNGADLGDTGNDITIHQGRAYVVVNGSDKIEVIDVKTHARVKTITMPPGSSPRKIVFAGNGTGYITNLFMNSVSIYDDASSILTGSIPVGDNPEGMLIANGRLYVANSGFGNGRTISVIDLATNTVTRTLFVGDNPSALAAVSATTAVVLCTGAYNDFQDPNDDTPGMVYYIDTQSASVTDSLELGGHPQHIALDASGNLYTVQIDGIQKVGLAAKMKTDAFIPGFFYGIAHDPEKNRLYVTNPLDYTQPGRLEIYSMTGSLLNTFTVGVIPGSMAFSQ